MRRSILLLLILICGAFTAIAQTVNIQVEPTVANGKVYAAVTIENNLVPAENFAPAFATIEGKVSHHLVEFSSRTLEYVNPRWSNVATFYEPILLDSAASPDTSFVITIEAEATGAFGAGTLPPATAYLASGAKDTIAIVSFDLKDPCQDARIISGLVSANLTKWYNPGPPGPGDDLTPFIAPPLASVSLYSFTMPVTVFDASVLSFCNGPEPVDLTVNGFNALLPATLYDIEFFHWDGTTTNSLQQSIGDSTFNATTIDVGDSAYAIVTDTATGCMDTTNSIVFGGATALPNVVIEDEGGATVSGTLRRDCFGHEFLTATVAGGPLPVNGQWLYGGHPLAGEVTAVLSAFGTPIDHSGSFSYAYSDDGVCWDTTEAYNLQVWPTPLASINSDKTLLCGTDSAELVTDPIEGGALILDGIGDAATAGFSLDYMMDPLTSFTIEATVTRTAVGASSQIVSFVDVANTGYRFFINSNDELVLTVGSGGTSVNIPALNSSIPTDFKRHVAVVVNRDDASASFYVNGVLTDQVTNPNLALDFSPINATFTIGQGFTGAIDEVRLWRAAINEEGLNNARSIPLSGTLGGGLPTLIAGYWNMDGTVGTPNNLTLVGDATTLIGEGFFKPGGASYTWNGPAGFFALNNDTTISTLPGTYNVEVDNSVCSNTSANVVIDGVVIVPGLPEDTTLCQDVNLVLDGPTGLNFVYNWTNNGGGTGSGGNTRTYTYDPDASTTSAEIYVTISRLGDCPVTDTVNVNFINNIVIPDTAGGFVAGDTAFMSWEPVAGATGYQYRAYRTGTTPPSYFPAIPTTDTSFQFNKTNPGIENWTFDLIAIGTCGRDTVTSMIDIGTCVNFPYTIINDSAWTTSLSDSAISFTWNPSALATFYDIRVVVNNVETVPWTNNGAGLSYDVTGLTFGDSVCFNYRARTSCDDAEAVERCVVAFNCRADFTGLRDTTQNYCTSSFKDLIEPDSVNNILGSYFFEGPGALYGDSVWYFDPQDAGFGVHDITMVGCYGADTVSKKVIVLPSPCTEVVGGTDIDIPFKNPQGIYTDCDGQIYFTDNVNNTIIRVDTFGVGSVILGVGNGTFGFVDGKSDVSLFNRVNAIVVHPVTGDMYFTDGGNHAVRMYRVSDSTVITLAGGGNQLGIGDGQSGDSDMPGDADALTNRIFNFPWGIAFNSTFDTLYIGDNQNAKIKTLALSDNSVRTIAGNGIPFDIDGPFLTGSILRPTQIKYDGVSNRLYLGSNEIAFSVNIRYLDFNNSLITTQNTGGFSTNNNEDLLASSNHQALIDVAADGQGNLFMLDNGMCTLKKYDVQTDSVITIAGTLPGFSSNDPNFGCFGEETIADKLAGRTYLNKPTALSVYVNGFVDVVDTDNERVLRIAIDDFINSPNQNLDSVYCINEGIDTLNVNTVAGFYTSVPAGYVSDNGTHWVFDPSVGADTVTVYFNHTIGACQGAEDKQVIIAPLPVIDLPDDTLFCDNYFGQDSVQVDSSYASYQWSFMSNDSTTFYTDPADTLFYVAVDSAGDYAVDVYSEFGCYATDTINISPRPEIDLSFTSTNGDTLCYGERTRLSIDNTDPTDPALASFAWGRGDTTQIITASATGYYTVDVIDVLGCDASDTFNLVVRNRPFATINVDTSLHNQTNDAFYGEYVSSVFAGRGTASSTDGISIGATMDRPWDIFYFEDTLYVTDRQYVRRISISDTVVSTIAGGGSAPVMGDSLTIFDAQFNNLRGLVVDSTGRIIFVDDNALKTIENDSLFIFAGDVTDAFYIEGDRYTARFDDVKDIEIDDFGNVYVVDYNNHRIRVINKEGDVSSYIGNGTNIELDGVSTSAQLNWPYGLAFDAEGKLYVIQEGAQKIAEVDRDTNVVHSIGAGTASFNSSIVGGKVDFTTAEFSNPWNAVIDDEGVMFFTEGTNSSVRAVLPNDSVLTILGNGAGNAVGNATEAQLFGPNGITLDPNTGVLYVADTRNNQIKSLVKNREITVCPGETVELDASASQAENYQWFHQGVSVVGGATANLTAADSGWYVVRVETRGCTNFDSIYVGYYTLPIANIDTTSRAFGGPTAMDICPNDTLVVTGNPVRTGFTYTWEDISNNPLGTDTLYEITDAGTYYLNIVTADGCTIRDTILINEFTGSIDLGNDTTTCRGVAYTFDAGTGFVNYLWQDNSTGQTFSSDTAGTFGVTVESTDGCFFTDSIDLAIIIPDSVDITPDSLRICNGDSSLITTAIFGASTGTYLWSNNGTTADTNYVSTAGYVSVQYTDNVTTCISYDSIMVTILTPPAFDTLVSDSIFCYTDTVNLIARSVDPTDSVFVYSVDLLNAETLLAKGAGNLLWDGVDSADVVSYRYVVDNGVCQEDSLITVEPTDVIAAALVASDTICFGDSVLIDATTSTGTHLPLAYHWSEDPANAGIITDTIAGSTFASPTNGGALNTYYLRVQDNLGCFAYDTVQTYLNLPVLAPISDVPGGDKDTVSVCSDGTDQFTEIYLTASGGLPRSGANPYDYFWFVAPEDSLKIGINGQGSDSPTIQSVSPIPDTVTVYVDITDSLGCVHTDSVVFKLRSMDIELTLEHGVVCPGLRDSIKVDVLSGGTGNYTYAWFETPANPATIFDDVAQYTYITPTVSKTYTARVYDVTADCFVVVDTSITVVPITAQTDVPAIICDGDTATVDASLSNGSVPFTNIGTSWPYAHQFEWSNLSADASSLVGGLDTTDVVQITGGTPGTSSNYQVIVTDSIGCKDTTTVTLNWNASIVSTVLDDTLYICNDLVDTLRAVTATGGVSNDNFTYDWARLSGNVQLPDNGGTEGDSIQLAPAFFVVAPISDTSLVQLTVSDTIGCNTIDSMYVINNNLDFITVPTYDTSCADVSNRITVEFLRDSNATGDYTFNWYDPADAGFLFVDSAGTTPTNNVREPWAITAFTKTFDLEITDNVSGCVDSAASIVYIFNIEPIIDQAPWPDDTIVACFGDDVTLRSDSSRGGTPFAPPASKYQYNWFKSATTTGEFSSATGVTTDSTVTITSNGSETLQSIWVLELTDNAGCTRRDSTTIYWNDPIVPSLPDDTIYVCTPDTTQLVVDTASSTGGLSPYTITWNKLTSPGGGANLLASTGDTVDVVSTDNDTTYFQVVLTDTAGCIGVDTVVVIGVQFEVDAIATSTQVCAGFNDTLDVVFIGDLGGGYSYTWTPNTELNDNTLRSPIAQPTVDVTYAVAVYDSLFGCTATDSIAISIVDLTAIAGGAPGLDTLVSCFENDTVTVPGNLSFGGVPLPGGGYNYNWSILGSTEVGVVGSTTDSMLVVEELTTTPIDTTVLRLIVEDLFGCIDTDYVAVYWNSEIQAQIADSVLYSCTNTNVTAKALSPAGGTPGYTYSWNLLSGAATLTGVASLDSIEIATVDNDVSLLELTVGDTLGCTNTDTVIVNGVDFMVDASAQFDTICSGLNDTLYATVVNDGIGGYSYLWSPNTNITDVTSDKPVVNPQVPTLYSVLVYDSTTKCSATATVQVDTVFLNAVAGATAGLDTLVRCFEDATPISLDASLTNRGSSPYNYTWSSLDGTLSFPTGNANPGEVDRATPGDGTFSTVYLDVVDDIGCTARDSVIVLWNSELIAGVNYDTIRVSIINIAPVCVGIPKLTDGLVTGGSGNYTYQWDILSSTPANDIFIVPGTETNEDAEIGAITPGASGNIEFTVFDEPVAGNVCSNSVPILVGSYEINVDLTINYDTVCPDTEVKVYAEDSDGEGLNPVFSFDGGLSYSTVDSALFTPSTSTTFRVEVIDDTTGCRAIDSVNVVTQDLIANYSVIAPYAESFCYADSIQATGTFTGGYPSSSNTEEWIEVLSNNLESSNNLIYVQPANIGNTDYVYRVTDSLGCIGEVTLTAFRNDSIVPDAGSDAILCSDGTLTIGGAPTAQYFTIGGGAFEYSWTGGDMVDSLIANPTFDPQIEEFMTDSVYQLVVDIKDAVLDCHVYDTVLVDVRALPRAEFAVADQFICADSSKTLYAYGVDLSYVYPNRTTFSWSQINPTVPLASTVDSLVITTGGEYMVVVTDSNNCMNSDTIDLTQVERPSLSISTSFTNLLCSNELLDLELINISPVPGANDTLQWELVQGNGFINDELANPTFYNSSSFDDTLEIVGLYINACATGSDTLRLSVEQPPVANFSVSDSTVNVTETVSFFNNSVSPQGNVLSYRWDFNAPGVPSSFDENPSDITYFDEGDFPAQLVVVDNTTRCEDTATVVIAVNGTHLLYIPNVFSPNATNFENRTLKMYGYGLVDDDFIFTVYNRWGEKVYEQTSFTDAVNIGWTGEYMNTGEPLDMGVYTYIVRAKYIDGSSVEKVGTVTLLR